VPWSPLYRGFFTGKYKRTDEPPEGSRMAEEGVTPVEEFSEEQWTVLDVLGEIANDHDASPTQVSIAWLLHKDVVTAPIIGPKTIDQLDETVGALVISLSDDEIERLEAPIDPAWRADICSQRRDAGALESSVGRNASQRVMGQWRVVLYRSRGLTISEKQSVYACS
jgi:1-deoxyxylulose-5-phosphate synthase